jgi:acyl-CoA reductase-like NAD-dependent aldehyde dehydrogenase
MADPDQRDLVRQQVEDARDRGSEIHTGGEQPDRKGYFYPPTVLSDLPDDADILHDESFGPILPIVPVQSEEEALERTNDSNFGLTSSIWTEDRDHARELARDVEAGSVYINDHVTPQGGPEVPWGGIKESGVGRTRGEEGLREMTEPKHIADERLNLDRDFFWYPYSDTFTTWLNRAMPWPFKWWLGG